MDAEKTIHVFIAYSRKDADILNELHPHLKVLERTQKIKVWYDGQIQAGKDWEQSINDNLHQADIILLLISQNFIASDYCYKKEMTQALALHDEGKVRVIPIIARDSLWQDTPLARLQALPKDGKPIASDWGVDKDRPYLQIVKEVKQVITDLLSKKQLEKQKKDAPNQFTDPRDGQTYKTVELLGKIWLAENLKYDVGEGCWYFGDNLYNGEAYGYLYAWQAAKKACPPGWRLPTDTEWKGLIKAYQGGYYDIEQNTEIEDSTNAYNALIEGGQSGFSAQLGGYRDIDGKFLNLSKEGYYWSGTEKDKYKAFRYGFGSIDKKLYWGNNVKSCGYSCRCLKSAPSNCID